MQPVPPDGHPLTAALAAIQRAPISDAQRAELSKHAVEVFLRSAIQSGSSQTSTAASTTTASCSA
eukprot:9621102-Alexandrium_andersonii.AAC.1